MLNRHKLEHFIQNFSKFKTFDEFYSAVIAQLTHIIDEAIGMARKYEHYVAEVSPSVMLSATMKRALEKKIDAYDIIKDNK